MFRKHKHWQAVHGPPRQIGSLLNRAQKPMEQYKPEHKLEQERSPPESKPRENRLPAGNWKPSEEFPPPKMSWLQHASLLHRPAVQRLGRISNLVFASLGQRDTIALLGMSVTAVYCIGAYEAWMLLDGGFASEHASSALRFVHRYAAEQILPSCVWGTKPASAVATACGIDGSVALRPAFMAVPPPNDELSVAEATATLQQHGLASMRSITAGSILLSQAIQHIAAPICKTGCMAPRANEVFISAGSARSQRLAGGGGTLQAARQGTALHNPSDLIR